MLLHAARLLSIVGVARIFRICGCDYSEGKTGVHVCMHWLIVEREYIISRQLAASVIACCFLSLYPRSTNFPANYDEMFTNLDR